MMLIEPRYPIARPEELLSPSLLIFRDLVCDNLRAMIEIAGDPERLRPHVKTHKMPAMIRLVESMGIHKHKCATIAEAEMVASSGGKDVLISYPIVGPNLQRLARLIEAYPDTTFRATVDDPDIARALSAAMASIKRPLPVLIDLEVGMGRTGISTDDNAEALYRLVDSLPNLVTDGLHAYDGHVRDLDLEDRRRSAAPGLEAIHRLRDRLIADGLSVPRLVLGGTPTFPIHAAVKTPGVECSPGTTVFYDAGYAAKFPDLPFTPAAILFTRVVSRPRPGRVCLDLGHKAVGADPAGARLVLLGLPDATLGGQSEEHLVVEAPGADALVPGTPLLAIPTHVCPTCALHSWAYVLEKGEVVDRWEVTARARVIEI
ncbi:D-TA family PLP-dependent enzyme [Tundrisphaera lichenicola]|uniref:D-TA family PLP-dependent enzyme n=1 Tax=Tundrisphaera lichenicola TaxID=2029860 RepID=UPI003EBF8F53